MHDDAECNVAADSQAKRKNDPLLHRLTDLSAAWKAAGDVGMGAL